MSAQDGQTKEQMLTQKAVLQRPGWSKKLLNELIPNPDLKVKNSLYSGYINLYNPERVEDAEKSTIFTSYQAGSHHPDRLTYVADRGNAHLRAAGVDGTSP